ARRAAPDDKIIGNKPDAGLPVSPPAHRRRRFRLRRGAAARGVRAPPPGAGGAAPTPRTRAPGERRAPSPRPGLELLVARLALPTGRLEVFEPGVCLLDLQQFLCELRIGHRRPPRRDVREQ